MYRQFEPEGKLARTGTATEVSGGITILTADPVSYTPPRILVGTDMSDPVPYPDGNRGYFQTPLTAV